MKYISTRGGVQPKSFSEVVLEGLARDGGLFVPESFPDFSNRLSELQSLSYQDLAYEIFHPFVAGEISDQDLKELVNRSYSKFDHKEVTPLVSVGKQHILELFHGPTLAFKDVALQMLGNFFEHFLKGTGKKLNILGATSGDTGSAAIHGVRGKEGIEIFMLHPKGRVSPVQEKQMTSVLDQNVHNIAITGTFDDAQRIVKENFNDLSFRDEYQLGAVNSINWARVMAQIVYYFYAAFRFKENNPKKPLRFSVPTGNFGDIFAGYMAGRMGLPIEKLILATNSNDILTRCFQKGDYTLGEVNPTYSPSMDIQLASNFERYLYFLMGENSKAVNARMEELDQNEGIQLTADEITAVKKSFEAQRVGEVETLACITRYNDLGYVLDPHTAVGVAAADQLGLEDVICLATAHPAKFDEAVTKATGKPPVQPESVKIAMSSKTRCMQAEANKEAIQKIIKDTLN